MSIKTLSNLDPRFLNNSMIEMDDNDIEKGRRSKESLHHPEQCSSTRRSDPKVHLTNREEEDRKQCSGSSSRPLLMPALVIFIGLVSSAMILGFGISSSKSDQQRDFEQVSSDLFVEFDQTLSDYLVAGQWIHQVFRSYRTSGQTQQDFEEVYDSLIGTGLEFEAIGFAMNVSSEAERRAMEAETREFVTENDLNDNYRGFLGMGETSLEPRGNASFYFPAHFVAPIDRVSGALDVDVYTSLARRLAIDKALNTWKPAMTRPLVFAHEVATGSDLRSVVLMHPGMPLPSIPDLVPRDVSLVAIRIPDVIKRAHNKFRSTINKRCLSIYIFDSTDTVEEPLFLGGAVINPKDSIPENTIDGVVYTPETSLSSLLERKDHYYQSRQSQVASGEWTFVTVASEEEFSAHIPFVILSAVFICVACTCTALWVYSHHKSLVQMEAEKAAVKVESARSATLMERELNEFIAHEVRNP